MMSTAILQEMPPASGIPVIGDDELYEVVNGQRVRTPPGAFAVLTASRLARFLGNFADGTIGRVATEGLFHLPAPINRDRRPDVAFVSFDRWGKNRPLPGAGNAWNIVPNLAIEVVRPNDTVDELEQKIAEYFRAGVHLVWVVYPMQSKVHVYSTPTQIDGLSKSDVLEGGTVVPCLRLPLDELFTETVELEATTGADVSH